ncbi:glycosyltransferase family 4 protein [Flagellimonas pelagia]|uniref:glycosyltransferase family 4 protein n=1 Tax=Flagellimonas pelagia TaxID=2306998 RepID=UPI001605224F|nr:glycosyltransferase family 4 protein [Allomuricauda maritima]
MIVHDVSGFADSDNGYVKRIVIGKVADKVLVHNQFSKATLLKGFPGEIEFKTHIVKHGNFEDSSVSLTSKEVARNILGLSGDKFYLLFFGQIKKVKGLELLLEALSNVIDKNVCLIIAGKPWKNDFNEYQKLIDDKGLADRIVAKIGFIENQDRDLLFSAADLLVLPYHRIYQSGVALMAMTFGVPLLTSDLEPFVELIQKDKNGNIFVSGNSESLANKILEVKENYSDALVKSQNGMRHVIEEYDWVKIARNYKEIL